MSFVRAKISTEVVAVVQAPWCGSHDTMRSTRPETPAGDLVARDQGGQGMGRKAADPGEDMVPRYGTRRVFDYVYAYFLHLFPKLGEEIVKLDRTRPFGTIRGHHQPADFDRPAAFEQDDHFLMPRIARSLLGSQ